jgi:SAM-dependent methyltransferase
MMFFLGIQDTTPTAEKLRRPKMDLLVDLAGGDGRYSHLLQQYAKKVINIDIDPFALIKSRERTSNDLGLVQAFIVDNDNSSLKLPVATGSVDACFSAAMMHLLEEEALEKLAGEVVRILKPGGRFLLELWTDINRTNLLTEKPLVFGKEPQYGLGQALVTIPDVFSGLSFDPESGKSGIGGSILFGNIINRVFRFADPPYSIKAKTLLFSGIKKA